MALQDLLAAIEAEAAEATARLRASRRREAAAIITGARQQARELQQAAVTAAEKDEREAAERRLAAARQEAASRLRDAQEDAYQQIARETRDRLRTARHRGDYPAILAGLLAEARWLLPAATVVRVSPEDEPLARSLLAREDQVRVEPTLDTAGGAEVADGQGACVRNTVEERFTAAEPALRALVGQLTGRHPAAEPSLGTAVTEVPA